MIPGWIRPCRCGRGGEDGRPPHSELSSESSLSNGSRSSPARLAPVHISTIKSPCAVWLFARSEAASRSAAQNLTGALSELRPRVIDVRRASHGSKYRLPVQGDVDRAAGVVQIRRAYANGRVKYLKTRLSRRAVPLQAIAFEALDQLRPHGESSLLFPNARGGHLDFRNFNRRHWKSVQKSVRN